jgi:hypothetical protein
VRIPVHAPGIPGAAPPTPGFSSPPAPPRLSVLTERGLAAVSGSVVGNAVDEGLVIRHAVEIGSRVVKCDSPSSELVERGEEHTRGTSAAEPL